MKRMYILISLSIVVISSLFAIQSVAQNGSKFDAIKQKIYNHKISNDPDGKDVVFTDVYYTANKDNDKVKKAEELDGFISDEDLAKKGGKYVRKELTTYRQYIDSSDDKAIRHDIDADRLVWVFTSKFDKTHYINGKPVEKAIVTTAYDAETGDFLFIDVTSEAPHGLDHLKERPQHTDSSN